MTTTAGLDFIVLAHPRSGSSLLRRLLNEVEDVIIPPESTFATWIHRSRMESREPGATPLAPADHTPLAREIAAARKFEFWGLTADDLAAWFDLRRPPTLRTAIVEAYRCYADRLGCGGALLGDKNNWHFFVPEAALEALAPARVILLFRDPVRVWASYLGLRDATASLPEPPPYHPDVSVGLDGFSRGWADGHASVLRACAAAGSHCDVVEYETVAATPEPSITMLLERLGRSQRPDGTTRRAEAVRARLAEPEAFALWKRGVPGPVNASAQPSARREVPPADAERISAACDTMLARLRLAAGMVR